MLENRAYFIYYVPLAISKKNLILDSVGFVS